MVLVKRNLFFQGAIFRWTMLNFRGVHGETENDVRKKQATKSHDFHMENIKASKLPKMVPNY